jgi:two-component sensor histidine kinase
VLVTVFETTQRLKAERAQREAADALRAQEARQAREAALSESEERFRALVTASSDVLYRMSPTWTEMRQLGGGGFLSDTDQPTQTWLEEYIPAEDQPEVLKVIREAVRTKSVFELEHRVRRADGSIGWTFSRAVPLVDSRGEVTEWFGAATDVTARRQAEDALRASLVERESLLKEVHHRVKNNLQVVSSLLEMQARQVDDIHAFTLFQEACNRVASIASIHEVLYRSGSFAEVEMASYAQQLVRRLLHFYRVEDRIQVEILGDSFALALERAVPCGLLLNELISNACKHAFPGNRSGRLTVFLGRKGDGLLLEVADSGVGLPEGVVYETTSSVGLVLVRRLAEQLGGTVRAKSGPGAVFEVNIPRHSVLR